MKISVCFIIILSGITLSSGVEFYDVIFWKYEMVYQKTILESMGKLLRTLRIQDDYIQHQILTLKLYPSGKDRLLYLSMELDLMLHKLTSWILLDKDSNLQKMIDKEPKSWKNFEKQKTNIDSKIKQFSKHAYKNSKRIKTFVQSREIESTEVLSHLHYLITNLAHFCEWKSSGNLYKNIDEQVQNSTPKQLITRIDNNYQETMRILFEIKAIVGEDHSFLEVNKSITPQLILLSSRFQELATLYHRNQENSSFGIRSNKKMEKMDKKKLSDQVVYTYKNSEVLFETVKLLFQIVKLKKYYQISF